MGAVATDRHQGVEVLVDRRQDALTAPFGVVEVVSGGAEQGAALGDDPAKVLRLEGRAGVFRRQSRPAVGDTDDLMAVTDRHLTNGANRGIQPRSVAPCRQDTDSHGTPRTV